MSKKVAQTKPAEPSKAHAGKHPSASQLVDKPSSRKKVAKTDLKIWISLIAVVLILGGCGTCLWLVGNAKQREAETAYSASDASEVDWSSYAVQQVTLSNSLTIASPGVYVLSGEISNGMITVDTNGPVKLVLDGAKITNENGPALNITSADLALIYLAPGSSNSLTDGGDYAAQTNAAADGTIYSKAKLVFDGEGALTVNGSSQHAIVAKGDLEFYHGQYNLTASQDAINGKQAIKFYGGEFAISAGDDGIHSDTTLQISDATINITKSEEGLEASQITINSGDIKVVSKDDGVNASDGSSSSDPSIVGNNTLTVNGGNLYVDAAGDGLDANGSIYINGGTIVVSGPTSGADGALDYDNELKITGGTLLAVGSSQMAQGISDSSTQYGIMANFTSNYTAGAQLEILDSNNKTISTFTSEKSFNSVVYSSPDLAKGSNYKIRINNTVAAEVTIEQILTTYSTVNQMGPGGGMMGGMKDDRESMRGELNGEVPALPDGETPTDFDGGKPGAFNGEKPTEPNGGNKTFTRPS